ncbi:MAG: DUF3343 domain-containing protein [Eubacteriales bacterium]|nr:DUF3343 domain-containing protein [Eubacteriales bacterium]
MKNRLQIPDFMLASFDSSHDAMHSEEASKAAGIKARLIPTPELVKAGCGLSLRMEPKVAADIARLLNEEGVKVSHWTLSTTIDGVRQFIAQDSPLKAKDQDK